MNSAGGEVFSTDGKMNATGGKVISEQLKENLT
jgi:hypothetical protein